MKLPTNTVTFYDHPQRLQKDLVTASYKDALTHYANLMDEAKVRLEAIHIASNTFLISPPLLVGFGYLQLRFLCETIALCCLAAHGDTNFQTPKKLRDEWKADKILSMLEGLQPKFYPKPLKIDGVKKTIAPINDGFLKKAELPQLYWKCGSFLHRGSLTKLEYRHTIDEAQAEFKTILGWVDKINVLLTQHIINLPDGRQLLCEIGNLKGQTVQVAILQPGRPSTV